MANEIRIPVEIDTSKALAELLSFSKDAKQAISAIGTGGGNGDINLNVSATANLNPLETAFTNALKPINQLENEMRALQAAINRSTDVTELKRLNDQIGRLQTQVNNLKVVGFESSLQRIGATAGQTAAKIGQLPQKAERAGQSLTDVGRVVQDLPYGFIGIANNLNPMIESFQRMVVQAGSTRAALRLMGASLIGPAGIGLGLSLVTTALSFATIGFGAWTRGMSNSSSATQKAKDDHQALADSIKQVTSELANELTKVTVLYTALNRGDLSAGQRKKALEELKDTNKEYFGALKDEHGLIQNLETAYRGYLNALSEIGRAKAIEAQLTKLFDQKLQLELQIDPKFTAATNVQTQKLIAGYKRQLDQLGGPINTDTEKWQFNFKEMTAEQQQLNKTLQRRVELTRLINQMEAGQNIIMDPQRFSASRKQLEQINLQIEGLQTLLSRSTGIQVDESKLDKVKDESDQIINRAKQVAEYLRNNTTFLVTYEFSPLDNKDVALKKAQDFLKEVDNGKLKLRPLDWWGDIVMPPTPAEVKESMTVVQQGIKDGIIVPLRFEPAEKFSDNFLQNASLVKEFMKQFQELKAKMPAINMEAPASFNYNVIKSVLEALKKTRAEMQAIGEMVNSVLTPAFEELFGAILEGKSPLDSFFDSLKQSINSLIKRLIAAALQAAILSAITGGKTSFAKAFGAVLGIKGFASGGLAFGPTLAYVGEGRGTNSSNPEVIAPLDRLKSFFNERIVDQLSGRTGGGLVSPLQSASIEVPQEVRIVMDGDTLAGYLAFVQRSQNHRG